MTTTLCENVMLDLETLGNGPDSAIVAIGAAAFSLNSKKLGAAYYVRVDLESAVSQGGVMDTSTILWWLKQHDEARLEIARECATPIVTALKTFAEWLDGATINPKIWGNGAGFDNVILRGAYLRAGITPPWDFRSDRCYRTIKALYPSVEIERLGTHHNALDDATTQALHLIRMLNPETTTTQENT